MSDFMLSQILIGIAFCFDVASFQFRDKQKVLICLAGASLLIALHFWFLQTHTAAVITVIAALRFLSATFTRAIWLMFTFAGLILGAAALTYSGLLTILVTVSSLLSTWGAFRASDRVFRLVMMTTALIMIVHNTLAQTPAGVLLEIFFLSSNLFAYYRYYFRR